MNILSNNRMRNLLALGAIVSFSCWQVFRVTWSLSKYKIALQKEEQKDAKTHNESHNNNNIQNPKPSSVQPMNTLPSAEASTKIFGIGFKKTGSKYYISIQRRPLFRVVTRLSRTAFNYVRDLLPSHDDVCLSE